MPTVKVLVDQENYFDSDQGEDSLDSSPDPENEEEPAAEPQDEEDSLDSSLDADNEEEPAAEPQDEEKSGMASVIARILSKDISKSNRVLLAKGKTSKEILKDISERKRQREKSDTEIPKSKHQKELGDKSNYFAKEEKRKIWESMGRKIPSVLDNPKEVKLRKIATQGMVQLFRLVSTRQTQG